MSTRSAKRSCEWQNCNEEGRYRIQTTGALDDIHWFCGLHARTFDLSVAGPGPFSGSPRPSWTHGQFASNGSSFNGYSEPTATLGSNIRMRHISKEKTLNYSKEDLANLKVLGLDTGATDEEIKKAYKTLVKHCHPDQNPDLENGIYIFSRINEAYTALKDKDFT